jgi:hypothetical protein
MKKTPLFKPITPKKPNKIKNIRPKKAQLDDELDKKLEDTFPASDATAKY